MLDYVRRRAQCTSRDVARDVFGGHGGVRTTARSYANQALLELLRRGEVERQMQPGIEFPSYIYTHVVRREPQADDAGQQTTGAQR